MSKRHAHARYKLAIVTWHDAFALADNHIDAEEHNGTMTEPFVRHSTGWLVKRRPVVLAQTYDNKGLGSTLTIPNGIVKHISTLEVVGDDDG